MNHAGAGVARRARRRLAGAVALSAAGTAALVAVGGGRLATPPLLHPGGLATWAGGEGPLASSFAILRLGAMGAGGYLCLVFGLALVTSRPAARRSRRLALGLLPRRWRTVLVIAAGLSSGLASSTAPALAAGHHPSGPTATAGRTAGGPAGRAPTLTAAGPTGARATPPDTPAPPSAQPAPGPDRLVHPPVEPAAEGRRATWTVAAGDSLWSIAAQVAAEHLGHPAPASEVAPYWNALVATNRARLPVPGDPDLLFVGDVVRLPVWPPSR